MVRARCGGERKSRGKRKKEDEGKVTYPQSGSHYWGKRVELEEGVNKAEQFRNFYAFPRKIEKYSGGVRGGKGHFYVNGISGLGALGERGSQQRNKKE